LHRLLLRDAVRASPAAAGICAEAGACHAEKDIRELRLIEEMTGWPKRSAAGLGGCTRAARSMLAGMALILAIAAPAGMYWHARTLARVTNLQPKPSLHHAILCGDAGEAATAIEAGEPINQRDPTGYAPIHRAAMETDTRILKLLLARRADVRIESFNGWTALDIAAAREAAELLIEADAEVNHRALDGSTPLMRAVVRDDLETVKTLLDHGADINVRNHSGETPLHAAVRAESPEVVRELLNRGAAVEIADVRGRTPRGLARQLQLHEIVALFVSQ
jgi:hypothetical protein